MGTDLTRGIKIEGDRLVKPAHATSVHGRKNYEHRIHLATSARNVLTNSLRLCFSALKALDFFDSTRLA